MGTPPLKIKELPACPVCGKKMIDLVCEKRQPLPKSTEQEKIKEQE